MRIARQTKRKNPRPNVYVVDSNYGDEPPTSESTTSHFGCGF